MAIDLRKLLFDKGLSQRELAKIIGTAQSEVSNFVNGRRPLLRHHLQSLIDYFGDDTINQYTLPTDAFKPTTAQAQVTILTPEVVNDIREEVAEELRAEVAESFPVLPEAVAIKPNTDLKEFIEENSSELEQVNPGQLLRSADMAERILRNSMYPTFVPGDIVFVQFLDEESKMNDGEIYYIKSRTRTSMIRQVKFEEGGKIRLIAQNERYADVIMSRGDLVNVGTVVGMLRLTFGDQYSEMENLRRTKEEQLNRFIDMHREMIAEIREQGKRAEHERERSNIYIDQLLQKK